MFCHELEYHLIYFVPNLDVSLKRNTKRDRNVPEEVIKHQYSIIEPPTNFEIINMMVTKVYQND